jgi:hypothetical protein
MSIRKWFRVDVIIFVCFIATVGWGITVWYNNHRKEVEHDAAYRAKTLAKTEQAKANLARLKNTWNADESWEHEISASGAVAPNYSLEIEHALVVGHPVIVVGTIKDVETSGADGVPVVMIENHYSKNELNLRFSLVATPDVANAILATTHNDPLADVKSFISAASIQRVEKIQQPPDKEGNDQDYFLAHGTLHEAYATQLFEINPKDLGEN